MKASRSCATGVVLVLACFAGGFGFGRIGVVAPERGRSPAGGGAASALAELASVRGMGVFERQRAFLGVVATAEIGELPGLLEAVAREVPEALGGRALRAGVVGRWAEADAGGLFRAMLGNRPRELRGELAGICVAAVAWDVEAAWELGMAVDAPAWREAVLLGLLGAMADSPAFVETIPWALSVPGVDLAVVKVGLLRLVESDPEWALKRALRLPRAAVGRGFYGLVIEAIGASDREAAGKVLASPYPGSHSEAIRGMFKAWARSDPERAAYWAARQVPAVLRDGALRAVLKVQLQGDPAGAASASEGITSPEVRRGIAGEIAVRWYAEDGDAALGWVRGELGGWAQEAALGAILDRYGAGMELGAQRRIAEGVDGAGPGKRRLVRRWVLEQPEAALRWAAAQPEEVSEVLVEVGLGAWLSYDIVAASRYIDVVSDPRLKRAMGDLLESYRKGGGDGG